MIPEKLEGSKPNGAASERPITSPSRQLNVTQPGETILNQPCALSHLPNGNCAANKACVDKNATKVLKNSHHMNGSTAAAENGVEPPEKMGRFCEWGAIRCSDHSRNTHNLIRTVVEVLSVEPNKEKPPIKLNLGDPSLTGLLSPHESTLKALTQVIMEGKHNGYGPSVGHLHARQALAKYVTTPSAPVTADDIILSSGCSHALQMAIEVLGNPGDNMLVPCPGFPLYETLMAPHGIENRFYQLLPEQSWEVDLEHMEAQIDKKTTAIIINNPSNPSGAVYSKSHLEAILRIAAKYHIPIIADEIYGDMVYDEAKFHPIASLEPKVPVLTCDGISKRWLVPGWRLGWLIINDHEDAFRDVRTCLWQLSTKIVGPSGPIQGTLPALLSETPESFFDHTRDVLSRNAKIVYNELTGVPGILPTKPSGAMYLMLLLDIDCYKQFSTEFDFAQALIREESVYCLPGAAFHYPKALRLVLTYPEDTMREACKRIRRFCEGHCKPIDRTMQDDEALCHENHSHQAYHINGHLDLEEPLHCHGLAKQ